MKKICFICAGNICRSAMAEFIFKDIILKEGLNEQYCCYSRAVRYNNHGRDMYHHAKECLHNHNIPFTPHNSTMLKEEEYDDTDVFFIMSEDNREDLNRIVFDRDNKVIPLGKEKIVDPWPEGDFEKVYTQITEGIKAYLKEDMK